mgnify:CR=1 FL=1
MYLAKLTTNDLSCIIKNMHSHNNDLWRRIDEARATVIKLKNNDLRLMFANCMKCWQEMDRELVECRRRRRITPKYTELSEKLDQALVVLEQHLVFGTLLKI